MPAETNYPTDKTKTPVSRLRPFYLCLILFLKVFLQVQKKAIASLLPERYLCNQTHIDFDTIGTILSET